MLGDTLGRFVFVGILVFWVWCAGNFISVQLLLACQLVVLNKCDLLPSSPAEREAALGKMKKRIALTLAGTRFRGAPMVRQLFTLASAPLFASLFSAVLAAVSLQLHAGAGVRCCGSVGCLAR